jgi:internalin A
VSLEELDLSSNHLEDLDNVQGLSKLTSLHVYWNGVKSLPEDFGNLTDLRDLYLTENNIKALPESMSKMVNLRTFMAHYNNLSNISSATVQNWTSLNVLNLSENDLITLPAEVSNLLSLTRLDLRANVLTTLPNSLSELKSLAAIEIGDNTLITIPPVIFEIKTITSLNLFSNGISVLPASIADLPLLTGLNLSFNQLTSLPAELATVTTLVHLRLEGNFFKEFPEPIVSLVALKELAIGSNRQIKELPQQISQLGSLTTFQASSNQIQVLPDTFVLLKNLTELDLSHNRLMLLPQDLDRLTALTDLDISGNALTRIPHCFGDMRGLQQVKASFNPGLTDVPPEYLKVGPTWISCSGNSKIEGEYYFAKKKYDKTGRWLPTEEEDMAPIDVPASIHHAQLANIISSSPAPNDDPFAHYTPSSSHSPARDGALATITEEPRNKTSTPTGSSPANTTVLAATGDPGDGSSTPDEGKEHPLVDGVSTNKGGSKGSSRGKVSLKSSDSSNPSTPTATSSAPIAIPYTTTSPISAVSASPPVSSPKTGRSSKDKKKTPSTANIDFHTPSVFDDRRLTILPDIGSSNDSGSEGHDTPSPSHHKIDSQSSSSHSQGSSASSTPSTSKKDKKKDKEERKRDKELLSSLGSSGSENLVTRTPQVGWAEMRGSRPDMQDSLVIMENFQHIPEITLIGLFDGHGGTETALLTAKKLPVLMLDSMRLVLEMRGLDLSLNSLLSLPNADLSVIIRATFMSLHGAVAKAGFTDGTAASVALVLHQYGSTPKTMTPPNNLWTTTNLNIIHGDEEYPEGPVASWCEKGKAAQLLLTTPPISSFAASQAGSGTHSSSWDSDGEISRPETPVSTSLDSTNSSKPALTSSSSKKHKVKGLVLPQNAGRSLFVLGNCGDQRAVLCRKGQAFALTKDHKPENPSEMARIARSGGFVAESRRVNGLLALSRAIGDIGVQPHVTFEPDIIVVELTEHDEFVIMACDGVWDVLSSEQAVYLALAESSPSRAANRIREYAFSLGSTDNISVIVYQLKPRERTNFGTCLFTHVAESQAIQAVSPRPGFSSNGTALPSPRSLRPRKSQENTQQSSHSPSVASSMVEDSTDTVDGPSSAPSGGTTPIASSSLPPPAGSPPKKRKKAKSNAEPVKQGVTDKEKSKDSKEGKELSNSAGRALKPPSSKADTLQ